MIHIIPLRIFLGKINLRFQNGSKSSCNSSRLERQDPKNSQRRSFSSLSPFKSGCPGFFWRNNFKWHTESARASKNLSHSDDLLENLGDGKIIPITIVTRFLDQNPEIRTKGSKEKIRSVPPVAEAILSEPKKLLQEAVSKEATTEKETSSSSKAVIPYSKNGSLRNEWTRTTAQRPKTAPENIHFRETYEKLKRLGLLKHRLGNCFVGMTSPSGKYKFGTEKNTPQRNVVGTAPASSDLPKKQPRKLPEIKSKFLQNNVVVKVQHFYESQGKEMPDDLKMLANGRSLRHRLDSSERSPYQASQRRFQLYPCTSPSTTQFTRNFKNVK